MVSPVLSRGEESLFSACTFAEAEIGVIAAAGHAADVGVH